MLTLYIHLLMKYLDFQNRSEGSISVSYYFVSFFNLINCGCEIYKIFLYILTLTLYDRICSNHDFYHPQIYNSRRNWKF
jgi:hypothetical protein